MTEEIPLDQLHPALRNANVMDADKLVALVEAFKEAREKGRPIDQPILARPRYNNPAESGYEIVDGHHRVEAARRAGYDRLPTIWRVMTDEEAARVAIALNRIRGELDLSIVGEIFAELSEEGVDPALLSGCGFSQAEVDSLIESATHHPDEDELPPEMEGKPEKKTPEDREVWEFNVVFAARKDRDRVRRSARKLGAGDHATGLVRLVEMEEGEGELDLILEAALVVLAARADSEAAKIAQRDLARVCKQINKRRGR